MRWVIVGAGAVGGVVGGYLAGAGHDVVLVARGAHLDAIRARGLAVRSPDGERTFRLPAAADPGDVDWRPGDVAVLATKSMDTEGVVRALAAHAPEDTPVVCLQNGVANEPAALRRFANVYGICVMLPGSHLEPGLVVAHSAPVPGILDVGRFPDGVDDTAAAVAAGLREAGFDSVARPDVMRMKYRKLLTNLGNALDALCGRVDGLEEAERLLLAEGEAVLRAAGIAFATEAQDAERRRDTMTLRPVEGAPRGGGSSWQSLARHTGSVEADYLNGEIVLLGRLHGVPTPGNALARRLVVEAARTGAEPGSVLTPAAFLDRLSALTH
jgi:2-dehydropantoate 2-reductase